MKNTKLNFKLAVLFRALSTCIFFLALFILIFLFTLPASAAGTVPVTYVHDYPGAVDTMEPRSVPIGTANLLEWQQPAYNGVEYELESITVDKTPLLYTVTFNVNGGVPTPPAQTVEHGQKVSQPAEPTRGGYAFDGWYQTADFSGSAWDFNNDTVTVDMTLYAKWTAQISYIVMFVPNGGTPAPSMQLVQAGQKVMEPDYITKNNYIFGGWYTHWNFEGPAWNFSDDVVTDNTILYAKWMVPMPTYTVFFDANGGAPTPPAQTVEHGQKVSKPFDPYKDDYVFVSWYETPDFSGPDWNFNNNTVTEDMTLYARWLQPVRFISEEASTEVSSIIRSSDTEQDALPVSLNQSRTTQNAVTVWTVGQPDSAAGFTFDEGNEYRVTYHYKTASTKGSGIHTVTERQSNNQSILLSQSTELETIPDNDVPLAGSPQTGAFQSKAGSIGAILLLSGFALFRTKRKNSK